MRGNSHHIIDAITSFGSIPSRGSFISAERLVSDLSKKGVERSLSLSLQGVYHDYSLGNDETLLAAKESPFLVPVATLDPRRFYAGKKEHNLGEFAALRLFPTIQGWPTDFAPFRKILEKASREEMPVIIPSQGPGKATQIVRQAKDLGVTVVLSAINYSNLSEALVLLQEYDGLFLATDMLNTPDGVDLVSEESGTDRLIFGSNYPYTYFRGPLLAVERSELAPGEKRKILRENILRVLGMK